MGGILETLLGENGILINILNSTFYSKKSPWDILFEVDFFSINGGHSPCPLLVLALDGNRLIQTLGVLINNIKTSYTAIKSCAMRVADKIS